MGSNPPQTLIAPGQSHNGQQRCLGVRAVLYNVIMPPSHHDATTPTSGADRRRRHGRGPSGRLTIGLLCLSGAVGMGCGPDKQAQKQAQNLATFLEAAKHDPDLADPLGQAIIELAQVEAVGWVKEGPLLRGALEDRARQGFLVVLKYGHCYRFLGVAGAEVRDLDLLLFDANGMEVQRDVTQSATPVLGASASICPADPIAVRIEARMRNGSGPFAIALLRDPD